MTSQISQMFLDFGCSICMFFFTRIAFQLFGVHIMVVIDAPPPPHSLKDSNASPQVEIMEEEKTQVRSLAYNTLGVEGRVEALGWGLGQMTSGSIIHTNLLKPNNKLVSAWLRHFSCTDEPRAYKDSQDSS
jgi:hypothetical protein